MPTHIYCDEAGSTGNNLLDPAQPVFAYSAVAIDPDDADRLVRTLLAKHRPQGDELKGARLVKYARGRRIVTEVLEGCGASSMVSVWNKRFALASHFFEYVFEPVVAHQNSIFYRCGFHKFIANLIYVALAAGTERAFHTLGAFQRLVASRGHEPIDSLFPAEERMVTDPDGLEDVDTWIRCHRATIANNMDTRADPDPLYRWALDASLSAFWLLLIGWGARLGDGQMIVTCDESKPLYDIRDRFNIMIGRTDRPIVWFPSGPASPVFNLAEPVRFGRSHDYPALQLADVVASASVYAVANPREPHSRDWLHLLEGGLDAVFPEPELIDLRTPQGAVNALVLKELVDRTLKGQDLFDAMPDFIAAAYRSFPQYRETLPG